MKNKTRIFLLLISAATLFLEGCASVPQQNIQKFSSGVSAAKSQADTTFQEVSDLTTPAIIEYAAAQQQLTDSLFQPVLQPGAVASWDNTFLALQNYSQYLNTLTAPDLAKSYEDSAVNVATELKQVGSDFQHSKLVLPNPASSATLAAAFTELGDLLLSYKAQHDVKQVLVNTDPAISKIFVTMANSIGASSNQGLRGTVFAHWDQLKGEQQVAFISAKPTDRQSIAAKYASLLNQQTAQDLAMNSLRKSLLALADAHHALASNQNMDAAAAIITVEQELQNTTNLAARFQAVAK